MNLEQSRLQGMLQRQPQQLPFQHPNSPLYTRSKDYFYVTYTTTTKRFLGERMELAKMNATATRPKSISIHV